MPSQTIAEAPQQGVLWKRRDVFKNRWRPRWFVLQPEQGVLVYYLLNQQQQSNISHPDDDDNVDEDIFSTPRRSNTAGGGAATSQTIQSRATATQQRNPSTSTTSSTDGMTTPPRFDQTLGRRHPSVPATEPIPSRRRSRIPSWDHESQVSATPSTLEFDVVPRGTLVLPDCDVVVNSALSKPHEHFYAFTIRPPNDRDNDVHLAASSAELRDQWIQQIGRVCRSTVRSHHNINEEPSRNPSRMPAIAHNDPSTGDDSTENTFDGKWTQEPTTTTAYEGLPPALSTQIQQKIDKYLVYLQSNAVGVVNQEPLQWKRVSQRRDWTVEQIQGPNDTSDGRRFLIVRTQKLIPGVSPKHVLRALMDIRQRSQFEDRIDDVKRIEKVNPHTFYDYYRYKAVVWPTKPREFVVVLHWQILQQNEQRAILLMAFSTPLIQYPSPSEAVVRANLLISMYLLVPGPEDSCHLTRILSFDPIMNHGVAQPLANVVISQQGRVPVELASYLANQLKSENLGISADLSAESIIEEIVDPLSDNVTEKKNTLNDSIVNENRLTLEAQVFLLFGPVVLFRLVRYLELPLPFVWFSVFAFLSIRELVLLRMNVFEQSEDVETSTIPVRCRFSIDLKGALRFLANKKEDREELHIGKVEVSIVHLVISAVAKVLKGEPALRLRRVEIPFLWINHLMDVSSNPVTVSVSENGGDVVTLHDCESLSVQEIADALASAEQVHEATRELGECLIVTTGTETDGDTEIDIISLIENVTVVLVVGGVSLRRQVGSNESRPFLSVSLTLRCSQLSDIATCRHFVEELRKSLDFPEIVDFSSLKT